jgi:hypothetical protein
VLEGKRDMETIPPLKRRTQTVFAKKFCAATPVDKVSIECVMKLAKFVGEALKMALFVTVRFSY